MKKSIKKVLSLALVLVMLCSVMSISVFADDDPPEPPTYSVTFYIQQVTRDSEDNIVGTPVSLGNFTVTGVTSGTTLKTLLHNKCQESGSIVTNDVWNTYYPIYLSSLRVNGVTKAENYDILVDYPEEGTNTYYGYSWMFFYGTTTPTHTVDYPDGTNNTLGTKTVEENMVVTLSYEYTTFEYNP